MRLLLATLAAAMLACTNPLAPAGPDATAAPMVPTVQPKAPDLQPAAKAPTAPGFWFFESLTTDGARALVRFISTDGTGSIRFRVVAVDTNEVVEELELSALARIPYETISDGGKEIRKVDDALQSQELAAELQRAARLLAPFPLGASERIAAAPGAKAVAFNAGDWIYLADERGKVKRRLSNLASYDPWFTPDGKSLLFRRIGRSLDGVVSEYDIYSLPVDLSSEPRRLDPTGETHDPVVLSADGREVFAVSSHAPQIKTCVVAISLAAPQRARRVACLDGDESLSDGVLSTTGRWLAAVTHRETAENDPQSRVQGRDGVMRPTKKLAFRLRVMRVADGKVLIDQPHGAMPVAINDDGLVVRSTLGGEVLLLDATTGKERRPGRRLGPALSARFRNTRELVGFADDRFQVLDLTHEQ
jgi:hypothetical protein